MNKSFLVILATITVYIVLGNSTQKTIAEHKTLKKQWEDQRIDYMLMKISKCDKDTASMQNTPENDYFPGMYISVLADTTVIFGPDEEYSFHDHMGWLYYTLFHCNNNSHTTN